MAAKVGVMNPVTVPTKARPFHSMPSTRCTRSPTLKMLNTGVRGRDPREITTSGFERGGREDEAPSVGRVGRLERAAGL
jgi:hypothetical protein